MIITVDRFIHCFSVFALLIAVAWQLGDCVLAIWINNQLIFLYGSNSVYYTVFSFYCRNYARNA